MDVSNFEIEIAQVFIVVAICSKYILVSCQAGKRTSQEVVKSRRTQQADPFELCIKLNFFLKKSILKRIFQIPKSFQSSTLFSKLKISKN